MSGIQSLAVNRSLHDIPIEVAAIFDWRLYAPDWVKEAYQKKEDAEG